MMTSSIKTARIDKSIVLVFNDFPKKLSRQATHKSANRMLWQLLAWFLDKQDKSKQI